MKRGDRGQGTRLPLRDIGCGQITNIGPLLIYVSLNYGQGNVVNTAE